MHKIYLGDGVFVDSDGDTVILTTSNGIRTTNTIVLGFDEVQTLRDYLKKFTHLMK